ncbi:transcriptional activator NhaR [Exilibacterium tricleocarpae]|uniref:Transcriptional activator NhaR n=1 Tax=Exilibacterium tricleocarpae TaxID=2591008 RepID=A0A545T634_9GAMM|nr:transcriptional activator NhaR [Exilibacterium tricleocarpae]TQV72690.1 transcriptional activator NhaR [Exilibacterium tricleocarpae]
MASSINYKHLHYFWTVAHEGSIARASEKLHITPQTISGQLSLLERSLDSDLFRRNGRQLELTETGRLVLRYADDIFALGTELRDVLRGAPAEGPIDFIVGATSVLPKTIVYKILEPSLKLSEDIVLTSREGPIETILAELAIHKVDLVLSDAPLTTAFRVKAYNHFLGECGLSFFAMPRLARRLKGPFPQCLDGAPMLLPTEQHGVRRSFDQWLADREIYPKIRAQFDDSALVKSFGHAGEGAFFMPSIIEKEVCENFGVRVIGSTEDIKQGFYAISAERRVRHPAVAAICDYARGEMFS